MQLWCCEKCLGLESEVLDLSLTSCYLRHIPQPQRGSVYSSGKQRKWGFNCWGHCEDKSRKMYASAEDNGSHLTGDPQAVIHIFLRAAPITSVSIVFLVKGSGCCFAHWRSFMRTADWPAYLVAEDTQSEKDLGSFCGLKSGEVPD